MPCARVASADADVETIGIGSDYQMRGAPAGTTRRSRWIASLPRTAPRSHSIGSATALPSSSCRAGPWIEGRTPPLADVLATQFTVFNYDRRGRGPSGDTQPYAVQREIEDIDAVDRRGRWRGGPVRVLVRGGARPRGRGGRARRHEARAVGAAVHSARAGRAPPRTRPRSTASSWPRASVATRSSTSWPRSWACRPNSSASRGASRGGRPRRHLPTPWPTTPRSWATTSCRSSGSPGSEPRRSCSTGSESFDWMDETAKAIVAALPNGQHRIIEGVSHDVGCQQAGPAPGGVLRRLKPLRTFRRRAR